MTFPCAGKWYFWSKSEAKLKARVTGKHVKRKRLRAYHCRHCGLWHLTSQNVKALAKAQGK